MLYIISKTPRSDSTTGFVYRIKDTCAHTITDVDEHELLSADGGLQAIDDFHERHVHKTASPGKKRTIRSEPSTIEDGPNYNDRISVKINRRWQPGKILAVLDNDLYVDNFPRYTIQYDDGWIVKDRLCLPWFYPNGKRLKTEPSACHDQTVQQQNVGFVSYTHWNPNAPLFASHDPNVCKVGIP